MAVGVGVIEAVRVRYGVNVIEAVIVMVAVPEAVGLGGWGPRSSRSMTNPSR